MNTLRVLIISGDSAALNPKSTVSRRLRLYREQVAHLEVLVPKPSRFQFLSLWYLVAQGEKLPRPDIVTAQDPFFLGCAAWLIARYHQVPLELQVHTDVLDPAFRSWSVGNRVRVLLARLLLPRAQTVRVVSKRIGDSLISAGIISRAQLVILPIPPRFGNPDAEEVRSLRARFPSHDTILLTVSRLEPEKRIDLILEALSLVQKRGYSFQFIIVGDGRERSMLESRATHLGLSSRVHFVGQVSDPSSYYAIADRYLSLSVYEGYGLSLVEAAHAHIPIISTDVGIAAQVEAHLVPPRAEAVAALLDSTLTPASIPTDFTQSEEEYVHAIVRQWGQCSLAVIPKKERSPQELVVMKYVISGGLASVVDLFLLYFLTDIAHVWYVLSAIVAYGCAFVISFVLQKFWTFQNGALEHVHLQFLLYSAMVIVNMVLNAGLLYLTVEYAHLHYLSAQIVVGVLIASWSFFCYRGLFRKNA